MRTKYTAHEYEKIRNLVECSISASTKAEARRFTTQFSLLQSDVTGYSRIVYSELIAATEAASGAVRDKERLISIARSCLVKFEINCVE